MQPPAYPCVNAFDSNADQLLLSKFPLQDSESLLFSNAPFWPVSVLYSRIDHPQFGPVHLFCTHLSASVPFVDTSAANLQQSAELVNYVQSKVTQPGELALILGDFNTGK